jgi:hypothetical protein
MATGERGNPFEFLGSAFGFCKNMVILSMDFVIFVKTARKKSK